MHGQPPYLLQVADDSNSGAVQVVETTSPVAIDESLPIIAVSKKPNPKTIVITKRSYVRFPNGKLFLVGAGATITNGIVHYGAGSTLPNGMRIGGIAAESQKQMLRKFTPPPAPPETATKPATCKLR